MSCTVIIKDKNLKPENIKKDVVILKVKGTLEAGGGEPVLESKTVDSSTVSQNVVAGEGYDGLSSVTVNPYTLDSKTVDPSTSQQTVNSSVDGLSSVTVNAVTSSIDANIQAGNIKKDVSILGVVGTYKGSGSDGDWVMKAKAGTLTDLSSYHVGYDVLSKDYGMYSMFYNSNITNPPSIDSSYIAPHAMEYCFQGCNSITSISFPNLVNINSRGMDSAFFSSGITSASFPELTTVGLSGLIQCFYSCTSLISVSFPKLTSVGFRGIEECLAGCTNLQNVEINPAVISMTNGVTSITNLTLTATVTDNLSVSTLPNLIADSVLNIIEHLSLSVSGKTLTFYSSGLTITDYPDERIQTAYDDAVNAGWIINNLTIVAP